MTISDLTGIPRPTVVRKLNKLMKTNWIARDKNCLYHLLASETNIKELNKVRLNNINRISEMVSKFFNAARIYNV